MLELLVSVVIIAIMAVAVVVLLVRRKRQEERGSEKLRLALAEGQAIPLSLHPVIDPNLCVGSFSCIKACPEGEIIGVVDGVATLVEAAHCIGHARCAVECPVGAIKLVFGTAERGVDLPEVAETFESSRPGVYIVGELGGMGLIKNALRQGLLVGKTLRTRLKKSEANAAMTDVVVVGGGPAGIATAISCKQHGLGVRVLEQETLGGCIAHYPRGKVVMTEQINMPGYGPFGRALLSKEELLADIDKLVALNKIEIEEGQKVISIDGDAPFLSVTTSKGDRIQCRSVVLAIGLRGSPRKLSVPGEELPKVTYRLVEPEQYHGRSVLVVGGGDSAVEAAIQLAEESTANVTISYRQKAFSRCKPRNREKIKALIDEGRVRALFGTRVIAIEDRLVRLGPASDDDKGGVRDKPSAIVSRPATAPAVNVVVDDALWNSGVATVAMPSEEEKRQKLRKQRSPLSVTGSHRAVGLDDFPGGLGAGTGGPAVVEKEETRAEAQAGGGSGVMIVARGRARTLEEAEASTTNRRPDDGQLSMRVERKEIRLKNDDVIVSVGGELPVDFLNAVGVSTRRYHGDEKSGVGAGPQKGMTKAQVEARGRRRLAFTLFAIGASIIASLILVGEEYYWLPLDERTKSPLHALLRPSGLWGHGVGVAATTFMLANFLYALRKRWRPLKGKASIRTWLTFHMFVGIMSPLVIAFHAAFLVNNLLAVWTWVALTVVVGTGIFGRFLFGFVPAQAGKMLAVSELREQVSDIEKVLEPHIQQTSDAARVTGIFNIAKTAPNERTLISAVLRDATSRQRLMTGIHEVRPLFKDESAFAVFRESVMKVARARLQISFYATLKRVFRSWLVFHVVTAIFMVILIGAHVAVTTYLGFGAFFQGGN